MLVRSACTGSLLEGAKRVAGLKVTPVPRALKGRLDAWSNFSGAVRVRPVPPAPEVPTDATVTFSVLGPMSSRIVSPAVMLLVEGTLMFVAPAGAPAPGRGCRAGGPAGGPRGVFRAVAWAGGRVRAALRPPDVRARDMGLPAGGW